MYIVVRCLQCRSLVLGNTAYKTRTCPQCGIRLNIRIMRKLGKTDSSREAIKLIQELKKRDVSGKLRDI